VALFVVLGLDEAALGGLQLLARGLIAGNVLVAQDVWRLGEHVVAEVHDHELGRQRLSGVPGRTLRLAAAAFRTRREVEIALPGEVLDLAAAEHRVLGLISKSIGTPLDSIGSSGPRPFGSRLNVTLSGARPMCRCFECSTISRNTSITPMCSSSAIVSIHSLAV